MPTFDRQAMVASTRLAAQMYRAWRADDYDLVASLISGAEVDEAIDGNLLNLVCGLLYVGDQLTRAAADGDADEYLEQLLGASLVAEATES